MLSIFEILILGIRFLINRIKINKKYKGKIMISIDTILQQATTLNLSGFKESLLL